MPGTFNNNKQVEMPKKHETNHNDKQNAEKGSLENLYEKIRDLKSEFQHVEEKMRSAVEALPSKDKTSTFYPRKVNITHHPDKDWDTMSSRSWKKGSEYADRGLRSSKSDYYPGKFTEKLRARSPDIIENYKPDDISRSSAYSTNTPSRVSSPTYPFLSTKGAVPLTVKVTPTRGSAVINLPFPDYGTTKSPTSDTLSGVSTPTYPFTSSTEQSFSASPEPAYSSSSSDHTIRPISHTPLEHCDTYIQIPVQKDRSDKQVEIGRLPLPSWEMKWQKVRRIPNAKGAMKSTNIEEETMSYEATVYEYRDV